MVGPSPHYATWEDMQRIFGLPKGCIAANVRIRPDELVSITCMFVGEASDELMAKRYVLQEVES